MGARWRSLWSRTRSDLEGALRRPERLVRGGDDGGPEPAGAGNILGYIFSRVGYECGRFLRELHDRRISWGTYQDRMCRVDLDEWHCNAHANNMVLLTEREGLENGAFLSFLDLDMAFDYDSYVDTLREPEESDAEEGAPADSPFVTSDEFDKLLLREKLNFMEVLAGGDSSTGVPPIAMSVVDGFSPKLQAVKAALYDTLLLGFSSGYCGASSEEKYPVAPFDFDIHRASYAVVKLAVIIMADYIA